MNHIGTQLARTLLVTILIGLPLIASAQVSPRSTGLQEAAKTGGLSDTCSGLECIGTALGQVLGIVFSFLGIVLLILFIYAGFLWMTAGGEAENVTRAKQILLNAVAGAIIVAAAFALTTFVFERLADIAGGDGGGGGSSSDEPASGSVPDGGACTDSSQCSGLSTCSEEGVCTDIGGGAPAPVTPRSDGEACRSHSECGALSDCTDGVCAPTL